MTQETAVVEKKVQNQGNARTTTKRITVKNVWEELGSMKAKIESMSAIIDASTKAKISPEILGAHVAMDKIISKMEKLEENLNSTSIYLGNKIDNTNSRLDKPIDDDPQGILKAQLESLSQRVDQLTKEIKTAKEKTAHSAELVSPWWGMFSIGISSLTAGVIVSMLPGISLVVSLGFLCIGGALSAFSAIKMWLKPKT